MAVTNPRSTAGSSTSQPPAAFVRCTTPVFRTEHVAMVVMTLALKRQHRIDDVVQRARSCNRSFFGHVADEKYRNAAGLGQQEKLRCHFTNLRDGAGRRFN